MRRRTNPWPAFVELFSALFTITLAGFIVMTGAYQQELAVFQKREQEGKAFRDRALKIKSTVQQALSENSSIQAKTRPCGDDLCIDFILHFDSGNDNILNKEEREGLKQVCQSIKTALDVIPPSERKDLGLVIEGHADSNQAEIPDLRERERYNWNLSARRATSVLSDFRECGLKSPEYQIVAIGYSDTMPIPNCNESTVKCNEKNRRTTLRLHADTAQIEERLRSIN